MPIDVAGSRIETESGRLQYLLDHGDGVTSWRDATEDFLAEYGDLINRYLNQPLNQAARGDRRRPGNFSLFTMVHGMEQRHFAPMPPLLSHGDSISEDRLPTVTQRYPAAQLTTAEPRMHLLGPHYKHARIPIRRYEQSRAKVLSGFKDGKRPTDSDSRSSSPKRSKTSEGSGSLKRLSLLKPMHRAATTSPTNGDSSKVTSSTGLLIPAKHLQAIVQVKQLSPSRLPPMPKPSPPPTPKRRYGRADNSSSGSPGDREESSITSGDKSQLIAIGEDEIASQMASTSNESGSTSGELHNGDEKPLLHPKVSQSSRSKPPATSTVAKPQRRRVTVATSGNGTSAVAEAPPRFTQIVVRHRPSWTQIWLFTTTELPNAFNPQVCDEFCAALQLCIDDTDTKFIVISSSLGAFCSGIDYNFLLQAKDPSAAGRRLSESLVKVCHAMLHCPKPLIVAVNGRAVGFGVGLALLGDIIIATEPTVFSLPYAQLGHLPEAGISASLSAAVGRPLAGDMLLTGRKLTAIEALRVGLVSQVVWPTTFQKQMTDWLDNVARNCGNSLNAIKALLRSTSGLSSSSAPPATELPSSGSGSRSGSKTSNTSNKRSALSVETTTNGGNRSFSKSSIFEAIEAEASQLEPYWSQPESRQAMRDFMERGLR